MNNSLKEKRKAIRLSQEKLAQKAGITRAYLSAVENGHFNPTVGVALKLANALNVAVDEIFFTDSVQHAAQGKTGTAS